MRLHQLTRIVTVALLAAALSGPANRLRAAVAQGDDLDAREEQSLRQAVDRVAPSIVRIETVGGLESVGGMLTSVGPTTGLVVSPDGYIASSAFNFVQKPASILVTLPDGTRAPARLVSIDHQRMIVLLKIDVKDPLPVPEAVPDDEVAVGKWAVAVGRTFELDQPNMSIGIISALARVWGKAVQTDAKVSPANYGGPLVDVTGRVYGVLVPLSPQGTSEVSGVEWYDSGIGFAIPLTHIEQVLPRMQSHDHLYAGIMGVSLDGEDLYAPAKVAAVRPNSPAYKAGVRAGDVIAVIDGQDVPHLAALRFVLNQRYAGDAIGLSVARDGARINFNLELVDHLDPYQRAFLGLLPLRLADAGQPGVVVRFVYPDSPAARAGVAVGDRITAIDGEEVADRERLAAALANCQVGQEVKIRIERDGAPLELQAKLAATPDAVPDALPEPQPPLGDAPAADDQRPTVGAYELKIPEFENDCLVYVPDSYDARKLYGLVVVLHPRGGTKDEETLAQWRDACEANDLIVVAPKAANPSRWQPTELAFIGKVIDQLRGNYRIDPARTAAVGREQGGAMAALVAFNQREAVRGAALVEAPFAGRILDNDPVYPLAWFIATAKQAQYGPQLDAAIDGLRKAKYPVAVVDQGERPRTLNDDEFALLVRWLDSLDKL